MKTLVIMWLVLTLYTSVGGCRLETYYVSVQVNGFFHKFK